MTIRFETSGCELTPDLEKYAGKKLARLNRRLPRGARAASSCTVRFTQKSRAGSKINTCEIILTAGGETFEAKESTVHMYAALDVVAVHVEQQLRSKYSAILRRTLR